jgi:hypothetical protein
VLSFTLYDLLALFCIMHFRLAYLQELLEG